MSYHQVVFASSEVYPFSKTGGLGDVMGALPQAIARLGVSVAVITPFYGRLRADGHHIRLTYSDVHVGYPWDPITADIYETEKDGVTIYFISRGEYFDRRFYYNDHKGDYFDNAERFIFFCRAVMAFLRRKGPAPAILHAQDWQTGLLPAFVHHYRKHDPYWANTSTAYTVHNLAFQGRFSSRLFEGCGLPEEAWGPHGVEYYGDFNFMKTAIAYADKITAVSPSYAKEILTPQFGCGMEGILKARSRDLVGILNGVDYSIWSPANNQFLPANYSMEDFSGKQRCKEDLILELGMSPHLAKRPILGFIGRLRGQKGIDLLNDIVPSLMKHDLGIVVLGEGNLKHEARSLDLMETYRGRYCALVEYTEDLAHRVHAGCDIFLMPSRYEPCGLTQLYALRYGTPPVTTAVGGLRDTIIPWPNPEATGFTFLNSSSDDFLEAILQAIAVWENNQTVWNNLIKRGMRQDYSWDRSAIDYLNLYRTIGLPVEMKPGMVGRIF